MGQSFAKSTPFIYKTYYVFNSTGVSSIFDIGGMEQSWFSLQVIPNGSIDAWNVYLEGSLDGINFTKIISHNNLSPGANHVQYHGQSYTPCTYLRLNCTKLELGTGNNITVFVLGK